MEFCLVFAAVHVSHLIAPVTWRRWLIVAARFLQQVFDVLLAQYANVEQKWRLNCIADDVGVQKLFDVKPGKY